MRKLFFIVLMLVSISSYAQVEVHESLKTPTWKLIALKYDKQITLTKWVPIFPKELRAIDNTVVELPGYIIPTKVGNRFSTFMLSIVPIESCPYCGTDDIPSMIEVKMAKPIDWTDKVIKIKGKLIINDSGDKRSEFFLVNAVKL